MLRITLELIPKGDASKKREIGTLEIINDQTGHFDNGNYDFKLRGDLNTNGKLLNFDRTKGYWSLIKAVLNQMDFEKS